VVGTVRLIGSNANNVFSAVASDIEVSRNSRRYSHGYVCPARWQTNPRQRCQSPRFLATEYTRAGQSFFFPAALQARRSRAPESDNVAGFLRADSATHHYRCVSRRHQVLVDLSPTCHRVHQGIGVYHCPCTRASRGSKPHYHIGANYGFFRPLGCTNRLANLLACSGLRLRTYLVKLTHHLQGLFMRSACTPLPRIPNTLASGFASRRWLRRHRRSSVSM